jgi:hypothetical protein
MLPGFWIQIHGELSLRRDVVDKLTITAPEIQHRRGSLNPAGKEPRRENLPDSIAVYARFCKTPMIDTLKIQDRI